MTALECVANVSEGRDRHAIGVLVDACGDVLIDVHSDPDHHRSVLTMVGTADDVQRGARSLARAAVASLDLSAHEGAHPRFGVVDVVPFVALGTTDLSRAVAARDAFASWAGDSLGLPCFLYGPLTGDGVRSLPDVRRGAFSEFGPDTGPRAPHPTAGAVAVGARPVLVAYNHWLERADPALARSVADALRGPHLRALGFDLAGGVQVSFNLLDPMTVGPAEVYDSVARVLAGSPAATARGARIGRAELVGLVPDAVLEGVQEERWGELDLSPDRTIEARLAARIARDR